MITSTLDELNPRIKGYLIRSQVSLAMSKAKEIVAYRVFAATARQATCRGTGDGIPGERSRVRFPIHSQRSVVTHIGMKLGKVRVGQKWWLVRRRTVL